MARAPSTRISRLTTAERTGRSMKKSLNFLPCPSSVLLRGRVRRIARFGHGADGQRRAVLELELPARHHHVTLLDAFEDGDLVTAGGTGGDEGLLRHGRLAGGLRERQAHRRAVGVEWEQGL